MRAQERVDDVQLWYHTMDVAPGVTTPGWFDLRPVLDEPPWPPIEGRRCLDVGTWDGHLAFELERRGASEVVALDIADHTDWDWLPRELAAGGPEHAAATSGKKGQGFEVASELLGSKVERRWMSIYDLDPQDLGTFDVVVIGALLLHLRDPFRALEAVKSVCSGHFLSLEQVGSGLTVMHPRRPLLELRGEKGQWSHPNVAGHWKMLEMAGFDTIEGSRYAVPLGPGHPDRGRTPRRARARARSRVQRWTFGGDGVAMSAVLSRPGV